METIIVIGAGAAGLMTAYELSKRKKKIIVLEAADRLGGRIHTYTGYEFSEPVELGAEFIHGKLPLTLNLLEEAAIKYYPVKGKMFHLEHGRFKKQNGFNQYWSELMKCMKELKEDMPLLDFLQQLFGDNKYEGLRESAKRFAEGFDVADVSKVSTRALYKEWSEEHDQQYRIEGGYQQLISFLESECKKNGCVIYNNCCVKKINWSKHEVNILTMCSRYFKSNKVVITVPLSVLQVDKSDVSYIEFTPGIETYLQAAKNVGYGTVVKIILEFNEAFWQEEKKNAGFFLTNEKIPTWWTQLPKNNCILTGWMGGLKALDFKDAADEDILKAALESLSSAFAKPAEVLKDNLSAYKINNWINVPNIYGAYSYETPQSANAKKILTQPVEETIIFAGEAVYNGIVDGTVEAALVSGMQAAQKILQ